MRQVSKKCHPLTSHLLHNTTGIDEGNVELFQSRGDSRQPRMRHRVWFGASRVAAGRLSALSALRLRGALVT